MNTVSFPGYIATRLVTLLILITLTRVPLGASYFQSSNSKLSPIMGSDKLIVRISESATSEGNGESGYSDTHQGPSMSSDGRFIVYQSLASNLVAGDTNETSDVFVYDQKGNSTKRVSVNSSEQQANGPSTVIGRSISGDGRYVVFWSDATNLVANDSNGVSDVFVRDLVEQETYRISENKNGENGNDQSAYATISPNGKYIAFASVASNLTSSSPVSSLAFNVFLFVNDRTGQEYRTIYLVSANAGGVSGNHNSYYSSVTNDGRFVAFSSHASNLVENNMNNGGSDVYLRDLQGSIKLLSASVNYETPHYAEQPVISADGKFVLFNSTGKHHVVNSPTAADGLLMFDTSIHNLTLISKAIANHPGKPGFSSSPGISSDGRYVAYLSDAENLVENDKNLATDTFLFDRTNNTTKRMSFTHNAFESKGGASCVPSVSDDGKYMAFCSFADDLVPNDTNQFPDVFVSQGTVLDVPSRKQGLEKYDDNLPFWESDEYDDGKTNHLWCGSTIALCGCALTSTVMVLSYYGIVNGPGNLPLNPGSLNTYMKEGNKKWDVVNDEQNQERTVISTNGYKGGEVIWPQITQYSIEAKKLYPLQRILESPVITKYNLIALKRYIDMGFPVIIMLKGPYTHWVVVKGYVNNQLIINNPNKHDPGSTESYHTPETFRFTPADEMRIYQPNTVTGNQIAASTENSSSFLISTTANSQILVTDPEGRRTGWDSKTSAPISEIPNSFFYFEPVIGNDLQEGLLPPIYSGSFYVYLPNPQKGEYQIAVQSIADSEYLLFYHTIPSNVKYPVGIYTHVGKSPENWPDVIRVIYEPDSGGQLMENTLFAPLIIR